jgi:hypothetical protein
VLIFIFKLYLVVVNDYFCVWAAFALGKRVQDRKMDETIKSCASNIGHSVLHTLTILSEGISLRYLYYAYQNPVAPV